MIKSNKGQLKKIIIPNPEATHSLGPQTGEKTKQCKVSRLSENHRNYASQEELFPIRNTRYIKLKTPRRPPAWYVVSKSATHHVFKLLATLLLHSA